MGKTLVIAEKPSVGRDLAKVLPGSFQVGKSTGERNTRWMEGPDHVITWAIGHLVQLAEPDAYDKKFKRWRMDDLPIVPERFKLVERDDSSKKQMAVIRNLLKREDVDEVINACDAGREGELIFRWVFEKGGGKQPTRRLWLSSMTEDAMRRALAELRSSDEVELLAQAAQSRSEADWLVGMNATRAATIRLRSSFDGAVSLGRVQTPTLAILARREEEIRAFVPEPYWLVDARFDAGPGADGPKPRTYWGRLHQGTNPRLPTAGEAQAIADAVRDRRGRITKLEKTRRKERAPLLYDLTSLQREAGSRFGFTARRTLAAAQRCYEEHKALTYPRTSSRFLTGDMIPEIKPTAGQVGVRAEYAQAAKYVQGLDKLPLGRVVNDAKVADHHAIIPTNAPHAIEKMGDDDRRIYDLVVRRFLAVFHPDAEFENTRIETTVEAPVTVTRPDEDGVEQQVQLDAHVFRTRGRVLLVPGWRGVYGEATDGGSAGDDEDEGRQQTLPRLEQGEDVTTLEIGAEEKVTKPPRRYSDASLLGAMETAGQLVDDEEAREAMKDSGIGTPATRAAIIERLIDVGYVERDGRALVVTEKGLNVIRLIEDPELGLTSPSLTGDWERKLAQIESGAITRQAFMAEIAEYAQKTVTKLDGKLKDVRIPRANLGPCPVCGRDISENRKGFSCWSKDDPGCGFVIWKSKAGKTLPAAVARELVRTGRTQKPVTGFKSRAGRNFRARLALHQTEEGKWRVEFDEPWAQDGLRAPAGEGDGIATTDGAPAAGTATGDAAGDGAAAA
ncbi:DNA topoisomerase 3 [Patulibacter brassicae]|uniref:DNA topoisomerase n=1 Tax=Patulibacter brassicae TaxID=1705717 RepID=A0ABU4VPL9_9ACTN|nr:DNA topoisomerase 3 [Patulibacter brassicae]MDX8153004.1 DNA topoisomerase 3 [Patulibacter brassicae]